jgi:hypothetical protein
MTIAIAMSVTIRVPIVTIVTMAIGIAVRVTIVTIKAKWITIISIGKVAV